MPGIRVRVGNRMVSAQMYKRGRVQARRKYYRRGARVGRKSFAQKVMAVVKRTEETKYVAGDFDATGAPHGPVWYTTPNIVNINSVSPALPQLTQGVGDYQRVGQKIQPTSLSVNLRIGLNPMDLSANSLIGVIYYGVTTQAGSWANANPLPTASFLDNGDGTNVTWAGLRNQLNLPTDRTLVKVKRITFRLSKTGGIQNSDVGRPTDPAGNFSTSNGLSEKNFVLRFKTPRTLVYNMIGDNYPQNYAPFYYVGFCHADGSAPVGATDNNLVNISSRCHLRFKDA